MRLEQVSIQYGHHRVLKSIQLEMKEGEIFVLMGPSGSGKTTLVKGMAGLIPFSEGEIIWEEKKGQTGLVFQEPRLFPHMTVLENIAFGLRVKGVSKKERNQQVMEFLKILQLEGLEDRYPYQLSGGQQQRVSLGRVLVLKPDLLLLDEPFASLDQPLRIQLTEWLYSLQRSHGFSVLWITHYVDEAFTVADRVGLLMDGEIIQEGEPLDFYQKPSSERVASFFALSNRFSRVQWQKWIPNHCFMEKTKEMGWIPAHVIYIETSSISSYSGGLENEEFVWIEGMVKRVKYGTKTQMVLIESKGECLEVELNVWEKAPVVGAAVRVGIPFNKIVWYPR
ncbi:ABC transporter ATP-binding protein [Neobacillus niacini]|uniref:ABC transporter ATP-binding protein n=1 Tax=Neobacillus niacini TaxID=86668 RepID=UPI0030004EE1